MSPLRGKSAIVTGGGTGIGAAIALAFAEAGANVVICGRREAPLRRVATSAPEGRGRIIPLPADVSRKDDVAGVVDRALREFSAIDVVVNNAGIAGGGQIHEHDLDAWDRIMAVNLRGPFLFCRFALPSMRARKTGHILNISSESGMEHYPGNGAYGVAKHALNDLGEFIQRENQDYGIRVDTICPGMVVTEMTSGNPRLDETRCLTPEDIADLAVWLITRRPNIKIGRPVLIQTMENPWL